jgi:hypothetical protein
MDQPLLLKIVFDDIPDNVLVLLKTTIILINILIVLKITDLVLKLIVKLVKFIYVKFNLGYVELPI